MFEKYELIDSESSRSTSPGETFILPDETKGFWTRHTCKKRVPEAQLRAARSRSLKLELELDQHFGLIGSSPDIQTPGAAHAQQGQLRR
jgi:hypothetical protein